MAIEKFLEKIPIDQVYEDLFKPGLRKAGEALATVLDLGNCALLPIKLLNEKSKMIFLNNIKRYQEKLEAVKNEEIIQVPEYVGIPILEKLAYLSEENISEAFINLLTKASTEKTLSLVHPAFISTLNDLSSDEAKLLFYLKDKNKCPFIDIFIVREIEKINKTEDTDRKGPKSLRELQNLINFSFQDREITELKAAWNLTGLESQVKLDFPDNIDLYLGNLERQKIIEFDRRLCLKNDSDYDPLRTLYENYIKTAEDAIKENLSAPDNIYSLKLEIKKGILEFTDYGRSFINACMADVKNDV